MTWLQRVIVYLMGCTHRLPAYPWQNEEKTDCQHKEDQNNGEQATTEDEGGPL